MRLARTVRRVIVVAGATTLLATSCASAALTSWSQVASPNVGALHNELHAVSASGTAVYAVGESFNGSSDRTLILSDVAGTWSQVTSPNVGGKHNTLLGVSVLSTSKAWAVGDYYGGRDKTLVLALSGGRWIVQRSPSVGLKHNELDAVAAGSTKSVWAVGSYFNGKADRTLIEHYNGSKWIVVPSPNVGLKHNALDAVSVVPGTHGTQAWAVGDYYNGVNLQTLILRLKSGTWTIVKSPNAKTQANVLTGVVALSASSAIAVGTYTVGHTGVSGHFNRTLAERWTGSRWTVLTTDNVGTLNNEFLGVFAKTPRSVYAVGRYFDGTFDQTLVQHWNGSTWHVSTSGDANTNHNELEGATADAGGASVAVGTYFDGTVDRTLVEACTSCT